MTQMSLSFESLFDRCYLWRKNVPAHASRALRDSTTGFKTGFVARLSERLVVKAGGGKGSEAC